MKLWSMLFVALLSTFSWVTSEKGAAKKTPYNKLITAIEMNKKERVKRLVCNTAPEKLVGPRCENPLLAADGHEDTELYHYFVGETIFGIYADDSDLPGLSRGDYILDLYAGELNSVFKIMLYNRMMFFEPINTLRSLYTLALKGPSLQTMHDFEKQTVTLIMKAHYVERLIEVLEQGFCYDHGSARDYMKLFKRNLPRHSIVAILKAFSFNKFSRTLEKAIKHEQFSDITIVCEK